MQFIKKNNPAYRAKQAPSAPGLGRNANWSLVAAVILICALALVLLSPMAENNAAGESAAVEKTPQASAALVKADSQGEAYSLRRLIPAESGSARAEFQTLGKTQNTASASRNNAYQMRVDRSVPIAVGTDQYDGTHTVGLCEDGTVVAAGSNKDGQCEVSDWSDIVSLAAGGGNHSGFTVGLCSDGTVVATTIKYSQSDYGQCDVSDWRDIVAIDAGQYHTVGLKSDGTVVATGYNRGGQCDVDGWTDITAISTEWEHTLGLCSDGTVVATGHNDHHQSEVSGWRNIVAVAAGGWHSVGLRSDGTVVAQGDNSLGQCNVTKWRNIVAIDASFGHTVGLRSDGTVVATGSYDDGKCAVQNWKNIIAIAAGDCQTVGLRSDGTVVSVGSGKNAGANRWKNIAPASSYRPGNGLTEEDFMITTDNSTKNELGSMLLTSSEQTIKTPRGITNGDTAKAVQAAYGIPDESYVATKKNFPCELVIALFPINGSSPDEVVNEIEGCRVYAYCYNGGTRPQWLCFIFDQNDRVQRIGVTSNLMI